MEGLTVTLDLYRRAVARAAALVLRNWPVLASVFAYGAILTVTPPLLFRLGLIGGLLSSLIWAACAGSFLYLVEMMVRTSRVSLEDFRRSFGAYLWDVVQINFVLFIFWMLVGPAVAPLPQGPIISLCISILIFVLFNAAPELIYLGHHAALALLAESYRFVADNWIEWFPPNFVLLVGLGALLSVPAPNLPLYVAKMAVVALFVYFAMVVRGLLFIELNGSSRRSRIFRHRAGG